MQKILIGYPLDKYPEFENIIQILSSKYRLVFKDYSIEWLKSNIDQFDILIPSLRINVDDGIIYNASKLHLIFTPTTGTDHIKVGVDDKNIKVLSLNDYKSQIDSISSTAELAFSLLMSLARKTHVANTQVIEEGIWERNNFLGNELSGKRMGIVGLGRIGQKIAGYGHAFGMDIVYWDKIEREGFQRTDSLDQLLGISDYIMVCVTLDDSTFHLISDENIKSIKKGCCLVNTSRGKVIDEQALCYAIDVDSVSGVGVDVLEYELDAFNKSPLYEYAKNHPEKNILITPHIGGATIDAWKQVFTLVFTEIRKGIIV